MPARTATTAIAPASPDPSYDKYAIFNAKLCPLPPAFMREAVRTLMRAMPIDPDEPPAWAHRRMQSALLGLAALHPRDEIEVMLAVQAMCAYHAGTACWYIGMNRNRPNGDSTRHIASAGAAARTFDTMLKALERRQAKPLTVPLGRPAPREWQEDMPDLDPADWHRRCQETEIETAPPPELVWTEDDVAAADAARDADGLDAEPVEGVLPDGSIITPEHPTPSQAAYIARRLARNYRREADASRRQGLTRLPRIQGIKAGELVP